MNKSIIFLLMLLFCVTVQAVPIQGTFMRHDLTIAQTTQILEEIDELGMDTVIIWATREHNAACDAFDWTTDFPEKFDIIFDEADARGINVYLGISGWNYSSCGGTWSDQWYDPAKSFILTDTTYTVDYLEDNYGNRPSFAGWYVMQEISIGASNNGVDSVIKNFLSDLTSTIKARSNKTIIYSPSIYSLEKNVAPSVLASKAQELINSGIDILLPQDSVGSEATNLGWDTSEYTTAQYYYAMSQQIGKSKLWANNEIFACCKFPTGTITYNSPSSVTRLKQQVENTSQYVSKNVVFTYGNFMSSVFEGNWNQGRFLAEYKAYAGIEKDLINPISYTISPSPSQSYVDSGSELTDGKIGDPKSYHDSGWVGITGESKSGYYYTNIVLDFGEKRNINWISANTLNYQSVSIYVPHEIEIFYSDDKTNWTSAGSWEPFMRYKNYEWTANSGTNSISNSEELNINSRYIKLGLKSYGWVFISEIDIVGDSCSQINSNDYELLKGRTKKISWANEETACCPTGNCVDQLGNCYTGGYSEDYLGLHSNLNSDGNDRYAYCYAGMNAWLDCDQYYTYCDKASYCGEADGRVPSGEINPFGEYSSFGEEACCGDDYGEFYVTTGNYSACCDRSGDIVNSSLECTTQLITEPEICTTHPSKRYDLGQLTTEIANWKNGNLSILEILLIAKIYTYCN